MRHLFATIWLLFVFLVVSFTGFAQEAQTQLEVTPLQPDLSLEVEGVKEKQPPQEGGQIGPARLNTTDTLTSVIVKLGSDGIMPDRGAVTGPVLTLPAVLGSDFATTLETFEANVLATIPDVTITYYYDRVFGGVALLLPANKLEALADLPGVEAIYQDNLHQPDTTHSPRYIGADQIWRQLGGRAKAGAGIIIGIIDTGIWPEHPSFSDPSPPGRAYPKPPATWQGTTCSFGSLHADDPFFACNNKLIGASRLMATYDALIGLVPAEFPSARDDNGHGTHVASTAAGNSGVRAPIWGLWRGLASGIAPRAHIAAYKACGQAGCFSSDLLAAVNQAVADGVNVINYSVGGGVNPYQDPVSLAFLDTYAAGIFVAASAGNHGPGADTVHHREPWVTTVGASVPQRHITTHLRLVAENGDRLTLIGMTVTAGIRSPTKVVVPPAGQELCLEPFAPGTFDGAIVACARGSILRTQKGLNVASGGASGLILYNTTQQELSTVNHFIPSVHLSHTDGEMLLSFLQNHGSVMGTFTPARSMLISEVADQLAHFSSRGGPNQTLGVSKPDLTAPGIMIVAGHTPKPATVAGGRPGELFQALHGTSVSSAHVSGAAALLKQLHPGWSPGQIRSALMTTAKLSVTDNQDASVSTNPFGVGSGRIALQWAGRPGLTFDVPAEDYVTYADQLWMVNYPSLYIPVMPGEMTVSRTVRNVGSSSDTWSLWVEGPMDLKVSIPAHLAIESGEEVTFEITIDAREVPLGEVRHATLYLGNNATTLHFPISIVRQQPIVTLDKSCEPAVFRQQEMTQCRVVISNGSFNDATVVVNSQLPDLLELVSGSVSGATEVGNGFTFNGTLKSAVPSAVSVAAGASPFGYLPLSTLGVPAVEGVGDEAIVNFTAPPFQYGGETYTRMGMVSNGYLVIGGGGSNDVSFVNQVFPDPARPNNALAPFWTDLNPAAGGALRAAFVTDGTSSWIVFDWEDVPNFSDGLTNSFQVWIELNGGEDITYAYGNVSAGDGGFLTVGAENKLGTSGDNFYVNGVGTLPVAGTGVAVDSPAGFPGDTHVITFRATGLYPGQWRSCVEMSSDLFSGINVACFSGQVVGGRR